MVTESQEFILHIDSVESFTGVFHSFENVEPGLLALVSAQSTRSVFMPSGRKSDRCFSQWES